jgi:NhaP-type Na+/H+ or K+/H+ antiporter
MNMGTNGQAQPRSTKAKRDTIICAVTGVVFALVGATSLMSADTWYLIMGACIMLVAAAMFVARSITSLRTDEYATSE